MPGNRVASDRRELRRGRFQILGLVIGNQFLPQFLKLGLPFCAADVSARRYHSTDFITGQVECGGLDADDGSSSAIKSDREGFIVNHPAYVAFARYMTDELYKVAKQIEREKKATVQ